MPLERVGGAAGAARRGALLVRRRVPYGRRRGSCRARAASLDRGGAPAAGGAVARRRLQRGARHRVAPPHSAHRRTAEPHAATPRA
eukprot:scaffold256543_cov27-Tisochrysis_lutea.AAC.2